MIDPRNYENTERDWERLIVDIDVQVRAHLAQGLTTPQIISAVKLLYICEQDWPPYWVETVEQNILTPVRIEWLRGHPL